MRSKLPLHVQGEWQGYDKLKRNKGWKMLVIPLASCQSVIIKDAKWCWWMSGRKNIEYWPCGLLRPCLLALLMCLGTGMSSWGLKVDWSYVTGISFHLVTFAQSRVTDRYNRNKHLYVYYEPQRLYVTGFKTVIQTIQCRAGSACSWFRSFLDFLVLVTDKWIEWS